jgi:hypothetical protein
MSGTRRAQLIVIQHSPFEALFRSLMTFPIPRYLSVELLFSQLDICSGIERVFHRACKR